MRFLLINLFREISVYLFTMKTIAIDIINDKVLNLLKDLEQMNLIKVRNESVAYKNLLDLKGAMKKQSIKEVDKQLDELRNEWV